MWKTNADPTELPLPVWYLKIIGSITVVIKICTMGQTSVFLKYCQTNEVNSYLLKKALVRLKLLFTFRNQMNTHRVGPI